MNRGNAHAKEPCLIIKNDGQGYTEIIAGRTVMISTDDYDKGYVYGIWGGFLAKSLEEYKQKIRKELNLD